jgi:hypothetical protein
LGLALAWAHSALSSKCTAAFELRMTDPPTTDPKIGEFTFTGDVGA